MNSITDLAGLAMTGSAVVIPKGYAGRTLTHLPTGGRIRILACMDDMGTTIRRTRRNLLGIALLGATGPLLAAAPRRGVAAARLNAALAYDGRNGDTQDGLYRCWGLGNEQFPDEPGRRLVESSGFPAVGHLGDAYGLMSVFVADLKRKHGMIVLAGGTSTDPFAPTNKGRYSSLARFQESILTALYRGAVLGQMPDDDGV
jgi:hypothetical protein